MHNQSINVKTKKNAKNNSLQSTIKRQKCEDEYVKYIKKLDILVKKTSESASTLTVPNKNRNTLHLPPNKHVGINQPLTAHSNRRRLLNAALDSLGSCAIC